ncbi:hypothetical protein Tco_0766886, partial [Tanacetum coccineum]
MLVPDMFPSPDPEADPEEDDDEDPEEILLIILSIEEMTAMTRRAPSAEETEPFETDKSAATPPPHPAYRVTTRISIPAPVPTPVWSDARYHPSCYIYSTIITALPMVITTSPDTFSTTTPDTISITTSITTTTSITPVPRVLSPLPPCSPISSIGEDRPKVNLPPQKRLGVTLSPAYEVGESTSAVVARPARGLTADYGFELALLCGRTFPEESDKIEKYVGGLPDMMVNARRRVKGILRTPQGTLKTNNNKNKKRGRTLAEPTLQDLGHFKMECPKLKNNNNHGNQVGGGNAPAKVYAVGHVRTNTDSNVVTGTFLLNNRYASILFDTGAD